MAENDHQPFVVRADGGDRVLFTGFENRVAGLDEPGELRPDEEGLGFLIDLLALVSRLPTSILTPPVHHVIPRVEGDEIPILSPRS